MRGVNQRALLAILLMHANEQLRTASLIDDLWGENPPATAPKAIQVYVSQLRKALGPEVVETHTNGYLLRIDPGSLDFKRFEELVDRGRQLLANNEARAARDVLREALGLWRGEALADVVDEGFARDEIARLTQLRLLAVEERIRADLALGRHVEVASELERLIKAHPLRESLRGLLMVALYRAGRQADALDVYRSTHAKLVEVGLEPVDELRALEKAILTHDPSLNPQARAVVVDKRSAEKPRRARVDSRGRGPRTSSEPQWSSGTLTFLFTNIEGSTRLLKQLQSEAYEAVLAEHLRLLRAVVAKRGGREVNTRGDSFFVGFARARDALAATIDAQRLFAVHDWPDGVELRVRMALHTGEATAGMGQYVGLGIHRVARISEAGHGGQVLVSEATRELLRDDALPGVDLLDLGLHELRDFDEPERIYQVVAPGLPQRFPPLRAAAPPPLRSGVLTFLLAAVDRPATRFWDREPQAAAAALVGLDAMIAAAVEPHGGRFLQSMSEGASRVLVFESAAAALRAAVELARALDEARWPDGAFIRARFGIHSGEAQVGSGRYHGTTVMFAARVCDEALAGEVLVSETTAALVVTTLPPGYGLVDLGRVRLEGSGKAEAITAVVGPGLATTLAAAECPYRGLLAFQPEDRHLFFGREEIVADVLGRIAPGRLLAVVGASGSGKSSLLRAGVLAAARVGELACARSARLLTPAAGAALDPGGEDDALLIVDQFEELYTQCPDVEQRAGVIAALLARSGPVVIGVRADFYGELGADAALAAAVAGNQVLLGPMLEDDLRRAIAEPARVTGLRLEPGLVDVVLQDIAGEPGALPLMSHALRETWERREGRTLTVEAYRASGGVSSALAKTADAVVEATPESERPLLRSVLLRLTEVGDDLEDTRRRAPLDELVPEGSSPEAVRALLERLVEARLVILDRGTAEVAHEVLIRRWPTLRRWLDEDREGIRLHRRLADAARFWDASGREPSDLYRGARLDAAIEWAGQNRALLNGTERDFLSASGDESARRQRITVGASLLAVAVATLLALFALISRNDAARAAAVAQSRALAANATAQQIVDPELAVLLASQAVRTSPTPDSMLALRDSIDAAPVRRQLPPDGLQNNFGQSFGGDYLAYSPNGRWLAESSDHGPVLILNAATRRVVRRLRTPWPATLGARPWSPDGKQLAVMTEHAVVLADTTSGAVVARITQMPDAVGVAFSPDARTLYGAGETPAGFNKDIGAPGAPTFLPVRSAVWVGAWEIAPRRFRQFTLPSPTSTWAYSSVQSAVLSPDGRRLAVGAFPGLAIFDTGSGRPVNVLAGRFQHPPSGTTPFPSGDVWVNLAYSPDGSLLAGADTNEIQGSIAPAGTSARVLDARALRPRVTIPIAGKYQVATAVAFSPDGAAVAYGDGTGAAAVYSLRLGGRLMNLPGLTTSVVSLAFSPSGTTIATATKDGQGWVWRTTGNEQLLITPGANPNTTTYAALERDRVVAALTPANGVDAGKTVVESWSRKDGRPRTRPLVVSPLADPGAQTSFSSDGRFIATGDGMDRAIAIWDIARRRIVARFTVPRHDLSYLGAATDWSPGDRYLAIPTFGHGHLWIWNRKTGQLSAVITNPIVCNMAEATAWSPNGALLAATNNCGDLWVVDTATGHTVYTATGLGPLVQATSFSPDDRRLLLTGATTPSSVTVIDVRTGRTVLNLLGITSNTLSAFYSPNGSLIETTSEDGVARIWDARTGELLRARQNVVGNGAVSDPWAPESSGIITVDGTGNIRVFDACTDCENPAALLALAKTHINRQLTPDERLIYHTG